MSEYTPSTEEVRSYSNYLAPEFDRWLAMVKADAWQEGRNVGIDNAYDSVFTRNPYRGESK